MIKKIKNNKWKFGIAIVVVIIAGYYGISKYNAAKNSAPVYTFTKAKLGTISTTVTGTGQVEAGTQVIVNSKVSGDIISLDVTSGQKVKKGDILAKVDPRDALIALENARIAYEKLVKPADEADIMQAQNAVQSANESKAKAETDLKKAYNDAYAEINSAFTDIPGMNSDIDDILNSNSVLGSNSYLSIKKAFVYRSVAGVSYAEFYKLFKENTKSYANLPKNPDSESIKKLLNETIITSSKLVQVIKDLKTTVDYLVTYLGSDTNSSLTSAQTEVNTLLGNANTLNQSLISALSAIDNAENSLASANRSILEKNQSLADLISGADELDIRSQKLSLSEKEYTYSNYFIRAPFDGVIAKVSVESTDTVSNGTAICTLISDNLVSTISLNEVDIAKVKVGQNVAVTFDAIDNLKIPATVSAVDMVGTVSQGVVSYNVKIVLSANDERVRSGMSVSATITTEEKKDIVTAPSSAIKTMGNKSYVEIIDKGSVAKKFIEVGITDDTNTEVISGLENGEQIILKTTTGTGTSASATTAKASGGLFGGSGSGTRTGGGSSAGALRNIAH